MSRHVIFRPRKRLVWEPRRSPCLRKDGQPKKAYTEDWARRYATELDPYPDHVLEAYECRTCGWWHLGNRRIANGWAPHHHRVVDREAALFLELGERAAVHLLRGTRVVLDVAGTAVSGWPGVGPTPPTQEHRP